MSDKQRRSSLGWRAYLALFIAFLETIALPLVIFIIVLIIVVFLTTR